MVTPSNYEEGYMIVEKCLVVIDDWIRKGNGQDKASSSIQDKSSYKSHTKNNSEKTSRERNRNE